MEPEEQNEEVEQQQPDSEEDQGEQMDQVEELNNQEDVDDAFDDEEEEEDEGNRNTQFVGGKAGFSIYHMTTVNAYSMLINQLLKDDKSLHKNDTWLPINPNSKELFTKFADGVLLCKLINLCEPDTIDDRCINMKWKKLTKKYKIIENLNIALTSCKTIGIKVPGNSYRTLIDGDNPSQVLGIIWQLILKFMLNPINLIDHPGLYKLLREGETLDDLKALSLEDLLLRWFNYHLERANHDQRVKNFSGDVKDGVNYTVLMNQLDNKQCDKSGLKDDVLPRCQKVLDNADKLEAVHFLDDPNQIAGGDKKLNLLFTASLFNACSGLEDDLDQDMLDKIGADAADGDPRAERQFKNWINSMDIDGVQINNILSELYDGIVLLKVLDRVKPGCVDWKQVELKLKRKHKSYEYKALSNCNQCIKVGKDGIGMKLYGINKGALFKKDKKLTLAYLWQLIIEHYKIQFGGLDEKDLVKWSNKLVGGDIKNFKDKKLRDGVILLKILDNIEERIDWDIIEQGDDLTTEQKLGNARYVLTVARLFGCLIFLTPEDIVEGNKKMIFTLVAALHDVKIKGMNEVLPEMNLKKQAQDMELDH